MAIVGMVVTADGVAVNGMRVPGKAPASVDVAVALADPDREGCEQRQLADVRPDSGPKLITAPREDVLEIGLEPTGQLAVELRAVEGRIEAECRGLGQCSGVTADGLLGLGKPPGPRCLSSEPLKVSPLPPVIASPRPAEIRLCSPPRIAEPTDVSWLPMPPTIAIRSPPCHRAIDLHVLQPP